MGVYGHLVFVFYIHSVHVCVHISNIMYYTYDYTYTYTTNTTTTPHTHTHSCHLSSPHSSCSFLLHTVTQDSGWQRPHWLGTHAHGRSPETSLPQKLLLLLGIWAEGRPQDHTGPSDPHPSCLPSDLHHPVTLGLKVFHTKKAAWSNPTQHPGSENRPRARIPSYEPGEPRAG